MSDNRAATDHNIKTEKGVITLSADQLDRLIDTIKNSTIDQENKDLLLILLATLIKITDFIKSKNISIFKLKKMIFGPKTEKLNDKNLSNVTNNDKEVEHEYNDAAMTIEATNGQIVENTDDLANDKDINSNDKINRNKKINKNRKKWGNKGYKNYSNASIKFLASGFTSGEVCPCCKEGKLYNGIERNLMHFTGNACPIEAERYIKEVMRCNRCNKEFMSDQKVEKWDKTAKTAAILMKAYGMPYERIKKLQNMNETPISSSTLWMLVDSVWDDCGKYIVEELIKEAANGNVFFFDDTRATILEAIARNQSIEANMKRACHTTVLCTRSSNNYEIVLYITAQGHAGENFTQVFKHRSKEKSKLRAILMSDASSNNNIQIDTEIFNYIIVNCMSHARRKFFDLKDYYKECKYFLKEIAMIYKNEKACKNYSPQKRLKYHKHHSKRHFNNIYNKINELFDQKLVEPNSNLGKAMKYWINHRDGLSGFLRIKGAPLDNNLSERNLRFKILERKNSFFNLTKRSAMISSGFSSIIKTCEVNNINPQSYLNWIQDNWKFVLIRPKDYMPWSYAEYIRNLNHNKLNDLDRQKAKITHVGSIAA